MMARAKVEVAPLKPRYLDDAEPVWELAQLFPAQGQWSEEEYLELDINRLVEYTHGKLEVLPMPSVFHQVLVRALFRLLERYASERMLGQVLFAPVSVQLW